MYPVADGLGGEQPCDPNNENESEVKVATWQVKQIDAQNYGYYMFHNLVIILHQSSACARTHTYIDPAKYWFAHSRALGIVARVFFIELYRPCGFHSYHTRNGRYKTLNALGSQPKRDFH